MTGLKKNSVTVTAAGEQIVADGYYTKFIDAKGTVQSYIVGADSSASIVGGGNGDKIYVEGAAEEYKVSVSGNVVTLKSNDHEVKVQLKPAKGTSLADTVYFLDGSLELKATNTNGKTAYKLGAQSLTSKAVDVASGNLASASSSDIFTAGSTGGQTFTLTNDTDKASANVFEAGLVWSPGGDERINALQDEDVLTGKGANPTLNATLGNAEDNGGTIITPKLAGIETVNVAFTGSSTGGNGAVNALDLQDATGVKAVNITRVTQAVNEAEVGNLMAAAE